MHQQRLLCAVALPYRILLPPHASTLAVQGKQLEYDPPPVLSPVVTCAHEITALSPLYGKTLDDIKAEGGHIVLCIAAVDNHFLQECVERKLYISPDFVFDRRFAVSCTALLIGCGTAMHHLVQ
jgi:hypothetical protein